MSRNSETMAAGIKLAIFTLASILVTGLLAAIMGNFGFGPGKVYKAEFTSASQLEKGDDVRVAGVAIGEVKKVEHFKRNRALVTFRVKADVPVTTSTRAEIRFKNLVGDRYLAIEPGKNPKAKRLDADSTIPVANTEPALDLTTLFNGFKPLFTALDPDQVNELSMNLVQVLQGEGGTVASLLENTASLTGTLAGRDDLIGEVITNLSKTMDTVNGRSGQLTALIKELKGWMKNLATDRKTIGGSLDNISDLTEVVAGLIEEARPYLKADVAEL
ncbi:MAG TPA: MCE family protein, partial [Nocardioides sp.]